MKKIVEDLDQAESSDKKEKQKPKLQVPIHRKQNLTLQEAAAYSNIGVNRLTALMQKDDCNFVLCVGNKRLIKRRLFDEYIENIRLI